MGTQQDHEQLIARPLPWYRLGAGFSKRHQISLLLVLAVLPAVFLIAAINRHGVDVPFADEFTFVPFLEKAEKQSLTFSDLYAQHNEHRYVIPRILIIALTKLADGNLRAQMFFSAFLVTLTSVSLWWLIRRTITTSPRLGLFLTFLVTLLMFSPVQAENWTWGFQFVLFLSNLLFVVGLLIATSSQTLLIKFAAGVTVAVLATFTFGNGVLLWVLSFPVALLLAWWRDGHRRLGWCTAWFACAGATIFLYFRDFHRPGQITVPATFRPLDYYEYVTAFLGAHLSSAEWQQPIVPAIIVGNLMLALYISAAVYAYGNRLNFEFLQRIAPWGALGAYAISNAILASAARIGLGTTQALDSRYTSFSLYLTISVIGLVAISFAEFRKAPEQRSNIFLARSETALVAALFALLVHSYAWGEQSMAERQRSRLLGKGALLFSNVMDSGPVHDRFLMAHAPEARASANALDALGFLHPSMQKSADIMSLRRKKRDVLITGFLDSVNVSGTSSCIVEGWAVIPQSGRPADCVVLAYDEPGRGPVAFQIADEIKERTDVAASLGDHRLQPSGWVSRFDRSIVPAGPRLITAWAFDAKRAVLYPLGTPKVLP